MFKHVLSSDQFHDSDQDRKYRDAFFQKFRFQERGIMASEPYADPVADHGNSQQSSDGENITLHRISDTGRNGDKDGVKKCDAHGCFDRNAHDYQQRHDKDRAAGAGQRADSGGDQAEKDTDWKRNLPVFRLRPAVCGDIRFRCFFFVLPQKDGETGE